MLHTTIERLRSELGQLADEEVRQSSLRYFKEPVNFYGIKAAQVSRVAKKYAAELKGLGKVEILGLCEQLWRADMFEESIIACVWSERLLKHYEPADFQLLARWLAEYVNNWASCDTLCNHTIGGFLEKYPHYVAQLQKWAHSPNRWVRRGAAVSLIIPARRGKFLAEIFTIASLLLQDRDDLVQKGYGWMLKAASQAHQQEVFEFVLSHRATMPRTALRYAIEKMPAELKAQAMAR